MLQFLLSCSCSGRFALLPFRDESIAQSQQAQLQHVHIRSYSVEKMPDFRLVSRLLGRLSHTTLTAAHVVPSCSRMAREVAEIGQFAEVSLGLYDSRWMWGQFEKQSGREGRRMDWLTSEGGPLEGYDALRDSQLLEVIRGDVADFQVIIARRNVTCNSEKAAQTDRKGKGRADKEGGSETWRRTRTQLICAFSGTSNVQQGILDLLALQVNHKPPCRANAKGGPSSSRTNAKAKVHAGFWRLYEGVRSKVLEAIASHLNDQLEDVDQPSSSSGVFASHETSRLTQIVTTGHSLGAALATFCMADLLALARAEDVDVSNEAHRSLAAQMRRTKAHLELILLGTPRVGNDGFVKFYGTLVSSFRELRQEEPEAYVECSVRAYNDGVPTLPFYRLNYRHAIPSLTLDPHQQDSGWSTLFHLHHNTLYRIPFSTSLKNQSESSDEGEQGVPHAYLLKNRECTRFPIQLDEPTILSYASPQELARKNPLGGHNYYNGRDFERTARRMHWAGGTHIKTRTARRQMMREEKARRATERRIQSNVAFWSRIVENVSRDERSDGRRGNEAEWEKVERKYRKKVDRENRRMGLS